MRIIQLLSGDQTRDYSKVMYDFGVACVGSGRYGHLIENISYYENDSVEWAKLKWLIDVQEGDLIVLHIGRSIIQAIGRVRKVNGSVYHHSSVLEDIDGWDLHHHCYVDWKIFDHNLGEYVLSRAPAQNLNKEEVRKVVLSLWSNEGVTINKPKYEIDSFNSEASKSLRLEDMMLAAGIQLGESLNRIKLQEITNLVKVYVDWSEAQSEDEIRALLVVPLLNVLGWNHQRMTIEKDQIDMLLFEDEERELPKVLIETKALWTGSSLAIRQAENYLLSKEYLSSIEKVLVTDGIVYWLYKRNNLLTPYACLNLYTLKEKNSAYPEVRGAIDFLKELRFNPSTNNNQRIGQTSIEQI
jgi:hypothetical protein